MTYYILSDVITNFVSNEAIFSVSTGTSLPIPTKKISSPKTKRRMFPVIISVFTSREFQK